MSTNIPLQRVKSSLIHSIGYDAPSKTLAIGFPRKGEATPVVYHYADFPSEKWEEFQKAESTGRHFLHHIKGKFGHKKQ